MHQEDYYRPSSTTEAITQTQTSQLLFQRQDCQTMNPNIQPLSGRFCRVTPRPRFKSTSHIGHHEKLEPFATKERKRVFWECKTPFVFTSDTKPVIHFRPIVEEIEDDDNFDNDDEGEEEDKNAEYVNANVKMDVIAVNVKKKVENDDKDNEDNDIDDDVDDSDSTIDGKIAYASFLYLLCCVF